MRFLPALAGLLLIGAELMGGTGCRSDAGADKARHHRTDDAPGGAKNPTPAKAGRPARGSGGDDEAGGPGCTARPFAPEVDLPEASGAAWVPASFGLPAHIVLVADSGNHGAFAAIDARSGSLLVRGALPLDGSASDDLEGLSRIGTTYFGLTSAGSVLAWRRSGADRFQLIGPAYPLADASGHALGCEDPRRSNCGRNFEGLCLADPPPASGCIGFAAAKHDGQLICLTIGAGEHLVADPARTIDVARPHALSGCSIAGDLLYTGNNVFGGNQVVRINGWTTPARAETHSLGSLGPGFCEAIAASPTGAISRFSDTGGAPSLMAKYSCGPPRR